ncbi:MAG: hypothetical protein AB1861_19485 [Cyanobacteriota bacterium]
MHEIRRVQNFNREARALNQPQIKAANEWLYERIEDFKRGLLNGYAETSIKQRIRFLKEKGFIQEKPSPNKFDKTRYYRLSVKAVQESIDAWWSMDNEESEEAETIENSDQTNLTLDQTVVTLEESNLSFDYISNNRSNNSLPPTPQGEQEGERTFGFEIRQESSQITATLLGQSEATQLTNQIVVKADIAPARVDPFFNRRRDPKDISWDWLPDGPWRTEEGKLEPEFWTAVATRWVQERGGDIHGKKVNVLKHFRNDPTNLVIEWEWYQTLTIHKAANIQTRKINGLDTAKDEQEIIKHSAALKELPNEMRVTGVKTSDKLVEEVAGYATPYVHQAARPISATPQLESVATVTEDAWDKIAADMDDMESLAMSETPQHSAPEGAENHEAYKQIVKPEDRDYWAKISQQGNKPSTYSTPVISAQQIKEQVGQINKTRLATSAEVKAKKLERSRIEFWNNQLRSGNADAIALTHEQVKKAGYIIVNGQVEDVEF